MPFHNREAFLEESGDYYTGVLNALTRLEGELDHLKNVEESSGLRKRTADIRAHLSFLLESPDRNTVFWIERRAAGGVKNLARAQAAFHTHLQATPIDVSELLTTTLFDTYNSVILTSATLTVSGGFDHIGLIMSLRNVKVITSTAAMRAASAAMQICGINGFRRGEDRPLERIFRDACGSLIISAISAAAPGGSAPLLTISRMRASSSRLA